MRWDSQATVQKPRAVIPEQHGKLNTFQYMYLQCRSSERARRGATYEMKDLVPHFGIVGTLPIVVRYPGLIVRGARLW